MSVTCSPNFWTGHRAGDLCLWYLEHDNSWRLLWQADVVQCIDGQMSDVGGHQLHSGYEGHLHPNHSGEYFEISQFFGKGEWGVILVILWRGGGGRNLFWYISQRVHSLQFSSVVFYLQVIVCVLLNQKQLQVYFFITITIQCKCAWFFFLQTNDGTTDVQVESIIKVQCETQLDKMAPTMTTDPNFQTLSSEILTLVCPNDCSNNGQCEGGKNNSQRMGFRCKVDLYK